MQVHVGCAGQPVGIFSSHSTDVSPFLREQRNIDSLVNEPDSIATYLSIWDCINKASNRTQLPKKEEKDLSMNKVIRIYCSSRRDGRADHERGD